MTSDADLAAAQERINASRDTLTKGKAQEAKPPNKTDLKAAQAKIDAGRALLRDGRGPKGEAVTEAADPDSSAAKGNTAATPPDAKEA